MSVSEFEQKVAVVEGLPENDRLWFPCWLSRYSLAQRVGGDALLQVNQHGVIEFARTLLENGAPAWQRWQAVRAVECYRDLVLEGSRTQSLQQGPALRRGQAWFSV